MKLAWGNFGKEFLFWFGFYNMEYIVACVFSQYPKVILKQEQLSFKTLLL